MTELTITESAAAESSRSRVFALTVSDLVVQDLTAEATGHKELARVDQSENESGPVLTLEFHQVVDVSGGGVDKVVAELRTPHVVYVQPPIMEMIDYLSNDGVCNALTVPTDGPPYKMELDIRLKCATVHIPSCASSCESDYLTVQCSDVMITNSCIAEAHDPALELDRIKIVLPQTRAFAHQRGTPPVEIVTESTWEVLCNRRLGPPALWEGTGVPSLAWHVVTTEASGRLSAGQMALILQLWYENVSLKWNTIRPPSDMSEFEQECPLLDCTIKLQFPTVQLLPSTSETANLLHVHSDLFVFRYTQFPLKRLISMELGAEQSTVLVLRERHSSLFPCDEPTTENNLIAPMSIEWWAWDSTSAEYTDTDEDIKIEVRALQFAWEKPLGVYTSCYLTDVLALYTIPDTNECALCRHAAICIRDAAIAFAQEDSGKQVANADVSMLQGSCMMQGNELTACSIDVGKVSVRLSQDLKCHTLPFALFQLNEVCAKLDFAPSSGLNQACVCLGVSAALHNALGDPILTVGTSGRAVPLALDVTKSSGKAPAGGVLRCVVPVELHVSSNRDGTIPSTHFTALSDIAGSILPMISNDTNDPLSDTSVMPATTSASESQLPIRALESISVDMVELRLLLELCQDGSSLPLFKAVARQMTCSLNRTATSTVIQAIAKASFEHFGQLGKHCALHSWQPVVEEFPIQVRWENCVAQDMCVTRLSVDVDSCVVVDVTPELLRTVNRLPPLQATPEGEVVLSNTLP